MWRRVPARRRGLHTRCVLRGILQQRDRRNQVVRQQGLRGAGREWRLLRVQRCAGGVRHPAARRGALGLDRLLLDRALPLRARRHLGALLLSQACQERGHAGEVGRVHHEGPPRRDRRRSVAARQHGQGTGAARTQRRHARVLLAGRAQEAGGVVLPRPAGEHEGVAPAASGLHRAAHGACHSAWPPHRRPRHGGPPGRPRRLGLAHRPHARGHRRLGGLVRRHPRPGGGVAAGQGGAALRSRRAVQPVLPIHRQPGAAGGLE
mmetsp:Transcript_30908/g.98613  ORF Transcript_30908/g.98613 Transcript_30908/m.98613 type:complete len:263 (-) Transcript_30908:253-1041(-)